MNEPTPRAGKSLGQGAGAPGDRGRLQLQSVSKKVMKMNGKLNNSILQYNHPQRMEGTICECVVDRLRSYIDVTHTHNFCMAAR